MMAIVNHNNSAQDTLVKQTNQKCSSSKSSRKQLMRLATLVAFIAVVLAQSVIVPSVEARYLPTRSNFDQVKKQEIKEILRLLLELPEEQQQREPLVAWNGGVGRAGAIADMYEISPVHGARHSASSGTDMTDSETRAKRDTVHNQLPKVLF